MVVNPVVGMDDLRAIVAGAMSHHAIWLAPVLLGGLLLALILVRRRGKARWKRALSRTLKHVGREILRDILIPDGVGGYIHVEYVLLTPVAVLVIDARNYPGALFGAAHLEQWTQMVNGGSYKFANPLDQNALRVQSVKTLISEVPVMGRVVFTEAGHFPKGMPQGVSMLNALKGDLAAVLADGDVPQTLRQAWERFEETARTTRAQACGR